MGYQPITIPIYYPNLMNSYEIYVGKVEAHGFHQVDDHQNVLGASQGIVGGRHFNACFIGTEHGRALVEDGPGDTLW